MSVVLSEHLPLLASAPGGIQKLRGLILELAVRGKLLPQDPDDEPAGELLKRIARERARLEAEGICKKSKPMPQVTKEEQNYSAPDGWQFARLGALLLGISSGGTPSKSNPSYWNGDIPWASVKDLGFGEPLIATQDHITKVGLVAGSFLAVAGSILVCTRMGLGKIGEAKIDVAINQDLKALQLSSEFNKRFFINYFKALSIKGSGMTVAGIKQDELLGFIVPVPPVAEQHRIVAKVDELMALCDRLEAEQADAASAHAQLVETLLGTLTQSTDTADLAANWQRLAEHFDTLFTTEASIDALKQTVLQLAVMGKLVPQKPNDEPASELLKRIAQERVRLETEGACKRSKPVPPVSEDEQPYVLPEGWKWVRLPEVCHVITDGEHITPQYADSGVPMLSAKHLGTDTLLFDDLKFVTPAVADKCWSRCCPEERDILVVSRGGGVGRTIISGTRGYCLMGSVLLFKPAAEVSERYLRSYLCSNEGNDKLRTTSGASAQQAIYIAHLKRDYVLPLPPLAEQHRIVAKVDELIALCDHLKTDLATARQSQARLADTLIESALEAA